MGKRLGSCFCDSPTPEMAHEHCSISLFETQVQQRNRLTTVLYRNIHISTLVPNSLSPKRDCSPIVKTRQVKCGLISPQEEGATAVQVSASYARVVHLLPLHFGPHVPYPSSPGRVLGVGAAVIATFISAHLPYQDPKGLRIVSLGVTCLATRRCWITGLSSPFCWVFPEQNCLVCLSRRVGSDRIGSSREVFELSRVGRVGSPLPDRTRAGPQGLTRLKSPGISVAISSASVQPS